MKLYNVTVRRPDAIASATVCRLQVCPLARDFSPQLTECMVWLRGTWLEVVQLNDENQLTLVSRTNFGEGVRSLCTVPAIDPYRSEQLAVGLESGELKLGNWQESNHKFAFTPTKDQEILVNNPRLAPTAYLVADPRGRVLVGLALESTRRLITLSLNLENDLRSIDTSVPNTFCYGMVMVDTGHNNPMMACLEGYRLTSNKTFTLYELNLGLRHMLKLWSIEVPADTNSVVNLENDRFLLITDTKLVLVAGGICVDSQSVNSNDNMIILSGAKIQSDLIILQVCDAKMMWVRAKDDKLQIGEVNIVDDEEDESDEEEENSNETEATVKLSIFCKFVVFESGFVFGIAESGDHQLLQIIKIDPLELVVVSKVPNFAPITSSLIDHRQLYVGSGQQQWSKYASITRGRSTDTLASTELPFGPSRIFTAKRSTNDEHDGLIVLGTPSSTTVLAVGDGGSVAEIDKDLTGIASNVGTLHYSLFVYGSVQVHSYGINYIVSPTSINSGPSEIHAWAPNHTVEILGVASTQTQLVLSLSNQQIVYFEESPYGGKLMESQNRITLPTVASAMCFAATNDQKSRGLYVALQDQSIRYFEVPDFKQTEVMSILYPCSSLVDTHDSNGRLSLVIGHSNGAISIRKDKEIFSRALGSSPVSLLLLPNMSVIAVSSRTWHISTNSANNKTELTPLSGSARLRMVQNFNTEQVQGLAAITDNTLEILEVEHDRLDKNETSDEMLKPGSVIIDLIKVDQKQLLICRNALRWADADSKLAFSPRVECAAVVSFGDQPSNFLAVSTGSSISIVKCAFPSLEIVHMTDLGRNVCTALSSAEGYLLAAMKDRIFTYKMGKKQLLKQHEFTLVNSNWIKSLIVFRNRVYVADSRSSVTVLNFDAKAPEPFTIMSADPVPKSIARMKLLDPLTVCIGNQYGYISVLRSSDPTSGSHCDLELIVNYRIPNEGIISLHKGALTTLSGKNEAIIYVGIQGTVGALIPFISNAEMEQLESLESLIIQNNRVSPHRYRGYTPNLNVVDGNVCELFYDLGNQLQTEIAESLETSIQEVYNLLESTKTRIAV